MYQVCKYLEGGQDEYTQTDSIWSGLAVATGLENVSFHSNPKEAKLS